MFQDLFNRLLFFYEGDNLALLGQKKALGLGKDGGVYPIETSQIAKIFCGPLEKTLAPQIEDLLEKAKIPKKKRPKIKKALLAKHLSPFLLKGYWLLRMAPYRNFLRPCFRQS